MKRRLLFQTPRGPRAWRPCGLGRSGRPTATLAPVASVLSGPAANAALGDFAPGGRAVWPVAAVLDKDMK
jgi:hypothetical protein